MQNRPAARRAPAPRAATLALAMLLALPLLPLNAEATHVGIPAACFQGNKVDVVIVLDRSGSMTSTDGNPTTRFQDAKAAATTFLSQLGPQDQSALVTFSTDWTLPQSLTYSHAQTQWHVNNAVAYGFTSIWAGLLLGSYQALNQLEPGHNNTARLGNPAVKQVMILLTDGAQTDYQGVVQTPPGSPTPSSMVATAKARGVEVFSIALGNDPSLPPWYPELQAVASSSQHFFIAPSGANLAGIFTKIFSQLRDSAAPTVGIGAPLPSLYVNGVGVGPSPMAPDPAFRHWANVNAVAGDDCQVSDVKWTVDVHDEDGNFLGTQSVPNVGSAHVAPYTARVDCDALPVGRHLLRATVTDFVSKTGVNTRWFWCLRPSIDAQAHALYGWVTNPVDGQLTSRGALLPTPLGGADRSITANQHRDTPLFLDASLLWDDVSGATVLLGADPSRGAANALSRIANLTFPTADPGSPAGPPPLGALNRLQRLEAIEAEVNVAINADAGPSQYLTRSLTGRAELVCAQGHPLSLCGPNDSVQALLGQPTCTPRFPTNVCGDLPDGATCQTATLPGGVSTSQCIGQVVVLGDLKVYLHEELRRSGQGFEELTVNAIHIVRDTAQQRTELILGQAYGGVSLRGNHILAGPQRSLDLENDAGLGRDAPDAPAMAEAVLPGAYQGRVASATDMDAYRMVVNPGEKLQVTFVASDGAHVQVNTPPAPPTAQVMRPAFAAALLDPGFAVRDSKVAAQDGAPVALELNVDQPGDWTWTVQARSGKVGDYTMVVTRVQAPLTDDNDALLQRDAGASCADAELVGPGVHVGTLEYQDLADAYRFQAYEKQTVAVALRPGDTVEAADMDLYVYDRACHLIGSSLGASPVKGMVELVTFTVPVGGAGLYRAVVQHVNGIGTYELVIANVPATT